MPTNLEFKVRLIAIFREVDDKINFKQKIEWLTLRFRTRNQRKILILNIFYKKSQK
jgi:hypothetical protein